MGTDELGKSLEHIKSITDLVQGWLLPGAGEALYVLGTQHAPNGTFVELGSWRGKSTIWLAYAAMHRGGIVYAVDTWEGSPGEDEHRLLIEKVGGPNALYEEFCRNIQSAGVSGNVVPIRANTVSAARTWDVDKGIGLLFIDASHEYSAVRRDFEMWSPYVVTGGLIVFDDVPSWPGPTRLVSELPAWYRWVGVAPNQWIVQKSG